MLATGVSCLFRPAVSFDPLLTPENRHLWTAVTSCMEYDSNQRHTKSGETSKAISISQPDLSRWRDTLVDLALSIGKEALMEAFIAYSASGSRYGCHGNSGLDCLVLLGSMRGFP